MTVNNSTSFSPEKSRLRNAESLLRFATRMPPLEKQSNRMQMLDCARVVAAVGVIASHVTSEFFPQSPFSIVGTFGVPFYLFIALYFVMRGFVRQPNRPVGPYVLNRIKKLYIPFLIWNLFYEIMHHLKHTQVEQTKIWWYLWAGSYQHLYFLPLLLGLTLILALIAKPLVRYAWMRWGVALVCVTAAIYLGILGPIEQLHDLDRMDREALYQMHRSLPSAFFAIAFAALTAGLQKRLSIRAIIGLIGIVIAAVAVSLECRHGQQQLLRALSGFGLVLLAMTPLRSWWLNAVAWAGQHSYGVYLSHIAFIRVGVAIIAHYQADFTVTNAVLIGIFAAAGSFAMSAILARFKLTQWIVGFEGKEPTDGRSLPVPPVAVQIAVVEPTAIPGEPSVAIETSYSG